MISRLLGAENGYLRQPTLKPINLAAKKPFRERVAQVLIRAALTRFALCDQQSLRAWIWLLATSLIAHASALDTLGELNNYSGQVIGELGNFASPLKHGLVPDNKYLTKKLATQHVKQRACSRDEGNSRRWDCEAWEYHERITELSRMPQGRARSSSAEPATLAGVDTPALDSSC